MDPSKLAVKRILFGNVGSFLIYNSSSAILVDCGYKGMQHLLLRALEKFEIPLSRIKLIILTHTHYDHAGGAKAIRELCGAPLAVHELEADMLSRGRTLVSKGTRWKGKVLSFLSRYLVRRVQHYPAINADIIIGDALDLSEFGIAGKVLHTPGHTMGSVSVLLENGSAIVGDNVLGISIKEHFPPFADRRDLTLDSWQVLIDEGMEYLYPAHGGRVKIQSLIDELPRARKIYL